MRILFTSSKGIGSLAIRAFEGGQASHCGVVDGDHVIDASFLTGVVRTPINEWMKGRTLIDDIRIEVPDDTAAMGLLRSQIGKSYDYFALVGFVFWRDWSSDRAWYCSELIMRGIVEGGLTLADRHRRIGVRMLREVAHAHRVSQSR